MIENLNIGDKVLIQYPFPDSNAIEGIISGDAGELAASAISPTCTKLWYVQTDEGIVKYNQYYLTKIPNKIKLFEDDSI